MPLLDPKLRDELQEVINIIDAAPAPILQVPEIEDLRNTLIEEVQVWRRTLPARLRSVINAMDRGQTPELQAIPDLRQALIRARQEFQRPGPPPSLTDSGQVGP